MSITKIEGLSEKDDLEEINLGEKRVNTTNVPICVLQLRCFKTKNMAMRYTELMYLAQFHTPSMLDLHIGESKGKKGCSLCICLLFENREAWSNFCMSSFRTKEMTMIKGSLYGEEKEEIYESYHMSVPSISKPSSMGNSDDSLLDKTSNDKSSSSMGSSDCRSNNNHDEAYHSTWILKDQDNVLILFIGISLFVFFLFLVLVHTGMDTILYV
jgi:hypothetical protein